MSAMNHARSFRDLVVYRKAKEVSRTIFELSKTFPKEETYSLTDQIRRAVQSIGAQIAEAWAKRRYEKHFVSKTLGRRCRANGNPALGQRFVGGSPANRPHAQFNDG